MKKLEIKTEKATLLVVDLPKCKTHLFYKGYYVMDSSDKGLNDKCRKISQGDTQGFYYIGINYKYLGKVSEITEEEWRVIIPNVETPINKFNCYPNYYIDGYLNTATESGLSLLKANCVILEPKNTPLLSSAWMEAQQEVWSNPHLFIKVD